MKNSFDIVFSKLLLDAPTQKATELQAPTVSLKELQLESLPFAKGSFGSVTGGFWNNRPIALKSQKNKEIAKHEGELHSQLFHPNIVLLLGISETPTYFCLVMERMDEDLVDYLKTSPSLSLERKVDIAVQITSGLEYLHNEVEVIHRDLKVENILINKYGVAKISDFGLATKIKDGKKSSLNIINGPWTGYAPELISKRDFFTTKTDIYAMAILLYCLLNNADPYPEVDNRNPSEFLYCLLNIKNGLRPHMKNDTPLDPIISQCWSGEPNIRPSATQLLKLLLAISRNAATEETKLENALQIQGDHIEKKRIKSPQHEKDEFESSEFKLNMMH